MSKQTQKSGKDEEENIIEELDDHYAEVVAKLPKSMVKCISSDDREMREQGIRDALAWMGTTVHKNMREEVAKVVRAVMGYCQRSTSMFYQPDTRAYRAEFFGKHPHLDKPELRGLLHEVTEAVMKEEDAAEWTSAIGDEVAKRAGEWLRKKAH